MIQVGRPVEVGGVVLGTVVAVGAPGDVTVRASDGTTYRITVPRPGRAWLLISRVGA